MDRPLSQAEWSDLGDKGVQALQMPFAARPLALVYSNGANATVAGAASIPTLRISPCNLAFIISGRITK